MMYDVCHVYVCTTCTSMLSYSSCMLYYGYCMHTYPYILFFNDSEIKLIQHTFAHTCSSESVCAHARKPALLLNVLSP